MKSTIKLIWIVVSDLEKSVKYYTEVMGLELQELHPQYGWAELSGADGARLGLAQANPHMDMAPGSNAIVTLAVKDLEAAKKELLQKGATLLGDTMTVEGHVKMQTVADSDGNRLQVVEVLSR